MKTEEKAKAYDMALERARQKIDAGLLTEDDLSYIFPEFRESENERIYNEIMEFFKMNEKRCIVDNSYTKWITWLEKHKEPKHAPDDLQKSFEAGQKSIVDNPEQYGLCKKIEWSEEDEHRRQQAINALDRNGYYVLVDWLKSLRPAKQEWSEEDERMVKFYEDDYNNNLGDMPMRDVIENRIKFKDWLLNRLKSIRPSWKPSEEQMEALEVAFRKNGDDEYRNIINSLYNDLKKL